MLKISQGKINKMLSEMEKEQIQKKVDYCYDKYNKLLQVREEITSIDSEVFFEYAEVMDEILRYLIKENKQ